MKVLPLDIENIIKLGVEDWQRNFFLPNSYQEENEPFYEILDIFKNIFDNANQTAKDLIIINYKLLLEYSNIMNAAQTLEKLKRLNIKPAYLNNRCFYEIFSPDYKYNYESLRHDLSISDKLRVQLRRIEGEFYNFRHKTTFSKNHFINIDKLCFLKKDFIKRNNIKIRTLHNFAIPYALLTYNELIDKDMAKMLQNVSASIANSMVKVLEKYSNGLFGKSYYQFFYHKTYNFLSETFKFYKGGLNIEKNIKGMLFSSFGNIHPRIAAILANKKGIETVGVIHGNGVGIDQDYSYYFSEFLFPRKYLVPTQDSKNNFELIKKRYSYFGKSNCDILSTNTLFYYKKWRKMNRNRRISTGRKVIMYIEIPATYLRYYYFPTISFFAQLDLSLRIFKLLKSQNKYKIILKAHPDRYKKGITEKLYDNLVDQIIVEPFEKVYHLADTYIFGVFGTTTFGHALLTNKEMICFDMLEGRILDEALGLLKKRIRFIKTRFDDRNRIIFDEKELLDALDQKSSEPNTDFIEKYMFPKRVK